MSSTLSLGVTEVLMFSFHVDFGIFVLIRIDMGNSSCIMLSVGHLHARLCAMHRVEV